jgi:hypothetical protein
LGLDVDALAHLHESVHIDFVIEVTDVSNDGVVLHLLHGFSHEDSLVTSSGDEDIGNANNVLKGDNGESFHACLKGTDESISVRDATVGTHAAAELYRHLHPQAASSGNTVGAA